MVFYKFLLVTACCMVSVADIIVLPIAVSSADAKPVHGECFLNNGASCENAGMSIQYEGEKCVNCTCGDTETPSLQCCMVEPFPLVNMPEHCDRYLNTTSCLYEFQEYCPDACIVIGYEYSNTTSSPNST